MADITMCNGNYCELAQTCYRYKAEPTPHYQSYFCKTPNTTSYDCEYYWECCPSCYQVGNVHKMSCAKQKIQINL